MAKAENAAAALKVIQEQMDLAIAAPKCHKCGCLQQTVEALSATTAAKTDFADTLQRAREVFVPREYDCLGCPICYPAIAANAFAEAYPEAGAQLDLCPTEEPEKRVGWPPLPGDYRVLKYKAPVAVCTLNSPELVEELVDRNPEAVAIIGTMHTENLGIERVIRNTLANPNVRFLLLCGEDTQHAIGHLPGQSLAMLFQNGIDDRGRIIGAKGKRPVLKNVSKEEVEAFRQQIEPVGLIGEERLEILLRTVGGLSLRDPGAVSRSVALTEIESVEAKEPKHLTLDAGGYFVVYPDHRVKRLALEHYKNSGVLDIVLEGDSAAALYMTAIQRGLVTRLDHAAYLGRELARAERSLETGEAYVQDKAAGLILPPQSLNTDESCGCSGDSCR